MQAMSERFSVFYLWYLRSHFRFKLLLFEHWFWLYDKLFGFMRVSFDKETAQLVETNAQGLNY